MGQIPVVQPRGHWFARGCADGRGAGWCPARRPAPRSARRTADLAEATELVEEPGFTFPARDDLAVAGVDRVVAVVDQLHWAGVLDVVAQQLGVAVQVAVAPLQGGPRDLGLLESPSTVAGR